MRVFSAETRRQAAAFDAIGERYDDVFPHKSGQIIATQWVIDRLAPGARVLDLGCGTGVPTAGMLAETGLEVVGVDVSTEMLALARRNVPTGRFVAMDLMELDGSLGEFDGVCAFFSLLMLRKEDIPRVLRRTKALLRPGAVVAIGMVEGDFDYAPLSFLGQEVAVTAFPRVDLESVIRAEGLHVLEVDVEEFEPASADVPAERQIFLYCSAP
ncbi:MAG: SAM-dependent methyltransferase [uncultured Corynebacteriales bacterium]|uniref:SAM-dependent methyltransferase n=1 Tax=uncultured Mycobacteriales bacterium TaxID=581187 RepID=A0A6J4IAU6_9ACTN|nr:MAG: SAM-dependent methyltransferase [uncultured Corynebacteriales bacterium]